ncbi:MAG TPA: polysaccharide deacetylase family protein [Pseudoxanthomonas sp.]|nr:polysaccharide deacetylase family protein [Pseudoxanthomonas sp.]
MRLLILLLCLQIVLPAASATEAQDLRIAVTIDDLPWARLDSITPPDLQARHRRLIAALKEVGVPGVGFVNENKLEVDGRVDPRRLEMLRDWLDAGYELGNHTYAHLDANAVSLDVYEKDILDGERQLRPLLAAQGTVPQWFRHPYLRAGRTAEDKAAIAGFLGQHGYRIAPVTVDNGEWVWAFAYADVMDRQADPVVREAQLSRLRLGYVPYMLNKLDYYEAQSRQLLGYALPQVWLMHANELNADCFVELVAATRRRGYRFITLEEALADPAYARPDGYSGRYGPSWLHRWAMAEKKPKEFYVGEPVVPKWVLDLAGLDSE